MKVYTYSQARQKLATLLDEAARGDEIVIRRRDGQEFVLQGRKKAKSPLDVDGIDLGWTRGEIVSSIREGRER